MKILRKAVVLFLMLTMICGLCFAAPKKKDTLDAAIRETSDYLNSNIAKGSKIVILNIQSESGALSEYIIDELISNAVNDRVFLVVDRQQLDAIRAEQNFQFSGEVDDKQAMEIGKFFGAQTIVSGAMGLIGKDYRLRVRALEVQTALVQGQFNKNITKSNLIPTLLASKPSGTTTSTNASARTTTTTASAGTATTTASSSSSRNPTITIVNNTGMDHIRAFIFDSKELGTTGNSNIHDLNIGGILKNDESKTVELPQRLNLNSTYSIGVQDRTTNANIFRIDRLAITSGITITLTKNNQIRAHAQMYNIGDTGPAGGIIFYDKKNNNGGWRYLEVAPVEAEFQAPWSIKGTRIDGLQDTIGSGKRNTQLITDTFNKTSGEWDTAAQKCVELTFGGFNDWFLPSKDDLDQMYGQLKRRNLGDLKNEWYYSSSTISGSAWVQNFNGGRQDWFGNGNSRYVRPIRQVAGPAN